MAKKKPYDIGVVVGLRDDVDAAYDKVASLGLNNCQLSCWRPNSLNKTRARQAVAAGERCGVTVSSFWAGYSGQAAWNFIDGPATIGLVPRKTQASRVKQLKKGADFAAAIGAPSISTHVGFIPEDPSDPRYAPLIKALKAVAGHCKDLGLGFLFETGQETPVTLLRVIEDVATGNLGINLDPANLILYGKANPVDALDVFGQYVQGVHAKDGLYPTNGRELGKEVRVGTGKVNFPEFMAKLRKLGYRGPITIEREISGPQQIKDIKKTVTYLSKL